jgi:hypothetical protein
VRVQGLHQIVSACGVDGGGARGSQVYNDDLLRWRAAPRTNSNGRYACADFMIEFLDVINRGGLGNKLLLLRVRDLRWAGYLERTICR